MVRPSRARGAPMAARLPRRGLHPSPAIRLPATSACQRPGTQYRAARADYVRVLIDRQQPLEARAQVSTLLQLDPGNSDYLTLRATASASLGEHEHAIDAISTE